MLLSYTLSSGAKVKKCLVEVNRILRSVPELFLSNLSINVESYERGALSTSSRIIQFEICNNVIIICNVRHFSTPLMLTVQNMTSFLPFFVCRIDRNVPSFTFVRSWGNYEITTSATRHYNTLFHAPHRCQNNNKWLCV